ncbi:MAG TPA: choice-of-anchor D domain-containing protein, partial [Terriglobales bacterium]|nr:choice-of-anchor D domain-containing protein [Terriglobales bacterium]
MIGKTSSLAALSLLFAVFVLSALPVLAQGGAAIDGKPVVILDDHHDVSPALRTIPKFKPARPEPLREFNEEQERENNERLAAGIRAATIQDPVVQSMAASSVAIIPNKNFDGIGNGIVGFSTGGAPPDTNGAIGATQYVQSVNASFAVFNKNTGALLLGPEDFRTLYTGFGGLCETNGGSDPVVLYDKLANRWILSILVSSNAQNFECFAVSTSADATGSYNRYAIPFGGNLNDFPKLGVWPDAYYFSGNEFDQVNNAGLVDRNFCAINRDAALIGEALQTICFKVAVSQTSGAVLPADMDGSTPPAPGEPDFFIGLGRDFASLLMFKFHVDFATPSNSTLTGPASIPVAPFNRLCPGGSCVPQPNTTQLLASIGDVPNFRVAYRNFGDHETIVLNHSVQAGTSGGVRWYELRDPNGAPTIFQQGTFAPDANWRWMAGLAIDKAGDIAVGYSLSSSTIRPSLAIAARSPSDSLGTLGSEQVMFSGAGSQTPTLSRWGDYSAMTVDPEDDCTFWYTNEYIPADGTFNWRTRIVSFSLSGCISAPVASLSRASLAFSSQGVGTSSNSQSVLLTNNGPGALSINSISASGDFSQTNDCATSLAVGASCTITVIFTPTAAGTSSGTLTVSDNSSNGPHAAVLTGTGVTAANGNTAIDFSNGFTGSNLTLNGGAAINGALLRITDGGANQARSAFFNTPVAVEFFTTDFTFQLTNAIAEGFTFTIQGSGPTKVGPAGSGLGYGGVTGGIPNSVAVKFDLANTQGEGSNSTGAYTNGAAPTVPAINLVPSGINLHNGDIFYVHMSYNGTVLAWTITDSTTGKSFSGSVAVDIPGHVGAPTAFVGFTGGTSGSTAIQDILTWSFQTPGVIAPFVSLSPASLAFGSQNVGTTSAAQTVTVTNQGPGTVPVSSITVSSDFQQTNNCPASLDAGTSCIINITFVPATAGTRLGTLTVTDGAFNGAQSASLIGIGLNAAIPVPVDFRSGFVAGTGLTLNAGAAINGTRLRITDGGRSEGRSAFFVPPVNIQSFTSDFIFQLTNATADGFTFAIQRSSPTAVGATGGGLGYGASSATGSGGIPNSIAIKFGIFNSNSTALLTNGAFPGTSSIDMTPSGINLHTGDIFYVHVTYDGVTLSWTVIDSVTGAVFSASKTIDIPTVIGGPAAFVGFTGGSGGLTAIQDILAWTFQTSGTISAYATLTPASLPFGNQNVGTSSAPQVATLTNNGPGTVNISGISISGDFAQTNNCGSSLAPGSSCVINISFTPTVSGPRAGTLTVSDDAAIAPQTVALSGLGVVNGGTLAVNFSGGFTSTGLRLNGAAINGTRLRITDGGTGQARSAYFSTPIDVHAFVNDFTFQLTSATADGFTFTVQNSAVTAVGGSGGGLGYGPSNPGGTTGGIAKSVAVKFDLFNSAGEGNNSTGLFTNGAFPGVPASDLTPSGVNLHSGDIFTVHMTYDGGTLAWTITDTNTGRSFSTSAPVNIPAVVGAPTAFIGFTGGTGGLTAIQDILSWTFQTDAAAPLA